MRNMDPMPIALRRLITESGLTDTEVWAAANITSGGLSHYLSDNRGRVLENRAAKTVRKLARVFDVAPDYFVEYRAWRLAQLARIDAEALTVAYDAALELARESGSLSALEARAPQTP